MAKLSSLKTRFIFIVGGVMSGIGKGIATASTARILQEQGFKVTAVKIDPYLNKDAGTMNPTEHGEVFVTDDGMETDQDIGNYERFLGQDIPKLNYMTSGLVNYSVIRKERNLKWEGRCVEAIPHLTNEIRSRLLRVARHHKADFVLVEVGGTVGEYQNEMFLQAARILKSKIPGRVIFILVSYLPVLKTAGEMKTKPTQRAAQDLNSAGIQPDIIIGRAEIPIDKKRKEKISIFCNVRPEDVISAPDVKSIYDVPVNFQKDNISSRILKKFRMREREADNAAWQEFVYRMHNAMEPVKIGIVGKYFVTGDYKLSDSYISVIESIKFASWSYGLKPEISWLDAETYEKSPDLVSELTGYDGIIVPGGFGRRGVEGKIMAARYARENELPYLGLCYGMQMATIEFSRNVCGLKNANTTEVDPATEYPVITTMADQVDKIRRKHMGGSMRLGAYDCILKEGTQSRNLYNQEKISERHRHRYEVNNEYVPLLEEKGMVMAGINPQRNLVEIIEIPGHRFFVGTQFHPEFKGRPLNPHPLFLGFIKAAGERGGK